MPLEFIPASRRLLLFWLFFALALIFFAVFAVFDRPLHTFASSGTVDYELAGSVEKANAMRNSWDETARLYAAFGLGFDFLFMPVYATALSLAVLLASDRRRERIWPLLGKGLGWGAYLAVGFDVVENIALFQILINGASMPLPQVAAICAAIKFAFLILGITYALFGWLLAQK